MAAEQYLIIFDKSLDTEQDLQVLFGSTLSDNKWSAPFTDLDQITAEQEILLKEHQKAYDFYYPGKKSEEPDHNRRNRLRYQEVRDKFFAEDRLCTTGEYSPLKAALIGDKKYYPNALAELEELIGDDLPIIDQQLIEQVTTILNKKHHEQGTYYKTEQPDQVQEFLDKNIGKQVFVC